MAYLFDDPNQDEEAKKQAAQGGAAPAGGTVELQPPSTGVGGQLLGSGGASAVSGSGSTPGQAGAPTSSGWTNLRAYLDANQTQAGDLADKISANISATGNAAKSAVDSGVSGYNDALAKASPANAGDLASRASSDPAKFVNNPNDVSALKNYESGVFNGPGLFESAPGYGDLATKAQSGTDLSTMAGSEGGQRTLLKNLEPNLSRGGVDLNQLLLSGVPGAKEKLTMAAQPFAGLRSYLDDQATAANAARGKAETNFNTGKQTVRDQFVTPQTKSLNDLEANISARSNAASQDFNKDQAIKDLQDYMSGKTGTIAPNEEAMFLPEGTQTGGYDQSAIEARVRDAIAASGNGDLILKANMFPQVIQQAVDYLMKGSPITVGQTLSSPSGGENPIDFFTWTGPSNPIINPPPTGDNGNLNNPSVSGLSPYQSIVDPIKADLWKYGNDPIAKLRQQGVGDNPDWLQSFFGGTQSSSGTASPASVASPQEAAKILALQQLLNGSSTFLTPEQLALAGTYRPSQIGKFKPLIQTLPGIPGFGGMSGGPGTPTQFKPGNA